jgi:malate synthase
MPPLWLKFREDKIREATDGHDGTWVAHPGLVPIALEAFDRLMPQANQIGKQREDVQVSSRDLLKCPQGTITEDGLRNNISVGIQYMASWLGGNGCVPIYHLMEDAATAEISRTQVWQWVHHPRGVLEDGRDITPALFQTVLQEELANLRSEMGDAAFATGHFEKAADLFAAIILDDTLDEFLTLRAYAQLD